MTDEEKTQTQQKVAEKKLSQISKEAKRTESKKTRAPQPTQTEESYFLPVVAGVVILLVLLYPKKRENTTTKDFIEKRDLENMEKRFNEKFEELKSKPKSEPDNTPEDETNHFSVGEF